jgi:hypothetical protein
MSVTLTVTVQLGSLRCGPQGAAHELAPLITDRKLLGLLVHT